MDVMDRRRGHYQFLLSVLRSNLIRYLKRHMVVSFEQQHNCRWWHTKIAKRGHVLVRLCIAPKHAPDGHRERGDVDELQRTAVGRGEEGDLEVVRQGEEDGDGERHGERHDGKQGPPARVGLGARLPADGAHGAHRGELRRRGPDGAARRPGRRTLRPLRPAGDLLRGAARRPGGQHAGLRHQLHREDDRHANLEHGQRQVPQAQEQVGQAVDLDGASVVEPEDERAHHLHGDAHDIGDNVESPEAVVRRAIHPRRDRDSDEDAEPGERQSRVRQGGERARNVLEDGDGKHGPG